LADIEVKKQTTCQGMTYAKVILNERHNWGYDGPSGKIKKPQGPKKKKEKDFHEPCYIFTP
jgi:hypothetical protein